MITPFINIAGYTVLFLAVSFIAMEAFEAFARKDDEEDFDLEATLSTLPGYSDIAAASQEVRNSEVAALQSTQCAGGVC
jgi:hypothetical protein